MAEKPSVKKTASRILIIAGLALIAAAAGIEAYGYPWGALFGKETNAASMPDPSPITLTGDDAGMTVVDGSGEFPSESPVETPSAGNDAVQETLPGSVKDDSPPSVYVQLGIIKIPKIGISQYVLEGTQRQMRYGVGHVTGTAAIGAAGNCAVAGHNTTSFHYLYTLADGDIVEMKAGDNTYTYTVYDSFTVLPDETWVLADVAGEDYTLTMITCTPYMISTHRLIVRARLTDVNGMPPETFFGADASTNENSQ